MAELSTCLLALTGPHSEIRAEPYTCDSSKVQLYLGIHTLTLSGSEAEQIVDQLVSALAETKEEAAAATAADA